MFIKGIRLKTEHVDKSKYPFDIASLRNLSEMEFSSPVTFFIGENGSGKSTLLEAIAVASGMNPEGGRQNYSFHTEDTHSPLYQYITLLKTGDKILSKFFLRAESFYNVCSFLDQEENSYAREQIGDISLHECSHGESFLKLIEERFYEQGLYILDEPEAALSPIRQMRLLVLINDLIKQGCQFIIATHSPILLAYPHATIYDFSDQIRTVIYQETEIYQIYKLFLEDPNRMLYELLEKEE